MKSIIGFAVKYPITISMIVLASLLMGYISFDKLGIELFPDLSNPKLFVEVKAGERPPEEMEKQFIEGIESLAIRQRGAVEVSSVCQTGISRVTVQYTWNRDMDEAFLDLQKALSAYNQNDQVEELTVSQYDPNDTPIMILGLYHPHINDFNELRKTAEGIIRNELIRLDGIADIKIAGQQEQEVSIQTDLNLLASYNLKLDDIVTKIQQYNQRVSGGSIEEFGKKYIIKGVSMLINLNDINNIIVGYRENNPAEVGSEVTANDNLNNNTPAGKSPIFLKDVSTVSFLDQEPENIVRINQKRSLGLSIFKETKYNTVNAVNELNSALEKLKTSLPGYEFIVIQNQGKFIQGAVDEVKESGLLGIFFAILILFIFLRKFETTTIIGIAIPISIVATFNLMYFNGLTLNVMTLGGLALGAGMLVDNAIVVMENIFRHRENGMSVREAAITGTSEVSGAITASTITTIIVFLPIVYLQGASGELFKDQAWTVAFSLVSSLVVAILVIPTMFNKFFKNDATPEKGKSVSFKFYGKALGKMLDYKLLIIVLGIILTVASYYLIPVIGSEYMPRSNTHSIGLDITLPEGTHLERTAKTVEQLESQIYTMLPSQIINLYSHIGPNEISDNNDNKINNENTAHIKILFDPQQTLNTYQIINKLSEHIENIPGIEVTFSNDESALASIVGTDDAPLIVEIQGLDYEVLTSLVDSVKIKMNNNSFIYNIESQLDDRTPQVEINVNRFVAGMHNIGVQDITNQIKEKLLGKEAGKLERSGELQSIYIKTPPINLIELNDLQIQSADGFLNLEELAEIKILQSPNTIYRRNQNRVASVKGQVSDEVAFDHIVNELKSALAEIKLPPENHIEIVGEELKRQDSMQNLTFALALSIILVYMTLASQFESLIHPFTIILTIPLAGVGAIITFLIIGEPLNIMAYIGIIMLSGIAVNDSIILVDAINKFKESGVSVKEAIINAGQQRIRPIIMTSLTTILALLPLTFGFGESASLRSPMAYAVIGGLVTSTLLTLVVIPCVYLFLDGVGKSIKSFSMNNQVN